MKHLGLDVHQARTTVVWFDDKDGEYCKAYQVPSADVPAHVQSIGDLGKVAMEAGSSSMFVARKLQSLGIDATVVEAHGAHRVLEAMHHGRKTDRVDALGLCKICRSDWLEELAVWVPDEATHELRALTRTRQQLVALATSLRNQVRALLLGEALVCPAKDIAGEGAAAWMDGVQASLPPLVAKCLQVQRQTLADLTARIECLTTSIEELAAGDRRCQQVDSLPGAAAVSAASVVAEIGDITRFPSAKALRAYAGLTPTISQSGARSTTGKLVTSCNKHLRTALIRIALSCAQSKRSEHTRLRKAHGRCFFRHGPNPAKVHLARLLCDVIFAMLRDATDFDVQRLKVA